MAECSALLEALWSPGDVLAALEISRCTSKPCLSGKWVVGLWGGCHSLRVKNQVMPPPAIPKGQQLLLAPRGCGTQPSPADEVPPVELGVQGPGRDGVFREWGPSQEGQLAPEAWTDSAPIPAQLEQQQQQ